MQQTEIYKFNLMESSDKFEPAPLNENAEKMEAALTALTKNIAQCGNCKISTGSYTGTGTCGSLFPTTITFDFAPQFIAIWGNGSYLALGSPGQNLMVLSVSSATSVTTAWSENALSFYTVSNAAYTQMNVSGVTYRYLILG